MGRTVFHSRLDRSPGKGTRSSLIALPGAGLVRLISRRECRSGKRDFFPILRHALVAFEAAHKLCKKRMRGTFFPRLSKRHVIERRQGRLQACPCMDRAGTAHIFGPIPEECATIGSPPPQRRAYRFETRRSMPTSEAFIFAIHQLAVGRTFLGVERSASLRSSRACEGRKARRIRRADDQDGSLRRPGT